MRVEEPRIKRLSAYRVRIRIREPFAIAIKTFLEAENLIVTLESEDGLIGYGESAPEKLITLDTVEEAEAYLKALTLMLEEADPAKVNEAMNLLEKKQGIRSQTARAAVDMAVYDLLGKHRGLPAYRLLSSQEPIHTPPTTLTVGIRSPEEVAQTVKRYLERYGALGLRRIKLKLEGDPERDLERVKAAASLFDGELVLDANQGYSPDKAVESFKAMWRELGKRILLIEEPCRKGDLEAMKYVSERVETPIFADESVVSLEDLRRVGETGCASGVNIKLQKAGGITPALEMAGEAEKYGLKLMVGSMFETTLSLSAAMHFVAVTPSVINEDLDSDIILFEDLGLMDVSPRETFRNGSRIPPKRPGLGVNPSPLLKALLSEEIKTWKAV